MVGGWDNWFSLKLNSYYEFLERGQAGVRNQSTSHSMHCVKNA